MIETRKYILMIVLTAALLLPGISFAAGTSWTAQNPGAQSALFGIAWSDQLHLFATVGTGGEILTGDGCGPWTAQNSGTTKDLYSVIWGGGQFVAVGAGSTILTSPDGATWTPHPVAVTTELWGVVWNGNTYVIVGNLGTIFTSPTGLLWSAKPSGTNNALMDVIWDGVKFVAVGDNGTILYSPSGSTWSVAVSVPVGTGNWIRGIAWNGPKYVAVGNDTGGNALILTSPDGASWTVVTGTSSWPKLGGIIWGDNKFVAVGKGGTILTSPFGNFWTQQASNTTDFLMDVAWNGCMFAAVGGASATGPATIPTSAGSFCCSTSTPACTQPPSGMVSWWDADAVTGTTATDIQGNNNGTLKNSATTALGKVDNAFSLNGATNDYVQVGSPVVNKPPFSVDAWVKPTSSSSLSSPKLIVANGGESSTGIGLALLIEKNQWRFYVTALPNVKGHAGVGIAPNTPQNWTHLAGTWDGTTNTGSIKLYVNGVLAATGTPILAQNNGGLTPNLRIGALAYPISPSAKTWDGLIDEVEIFDRVLTLSDIQDIYSAGAAGKCKSSGVSCVAPPNHMVSWWDADAVTGTTATDIQDSNDGTLMNGATAAPGKVGQAFSFDGVNDYVQVGSPVVNTPPFSLDAWVKPTSIPPSVSHNYNKYIVANGGETGAGYGLALLIEEKQWRFFIADASGFRGFAGVDISAPVWTHVAGTWDGSTNPGSIKLYVNGVLAATGTPTATTSIGTAQNLRIGAPVLTSNYSWAGFIDEVEIFDRVLTPSDIHDIYSAGAAGKCKTKPGKICGHKFNDLNGNGTWDQLLEPGLQGWTITATDTAGQSAGTATTDANGKYCIAVPASTAPYTVTEDIQSQGGNWMQTAPAAPGTHSVSVAVGQTVNNINFGNQKKIILNPKMTVEKTALKAPWQAGNTGTFEISATSPWTITGTPSVPIIIKDIVLNPPFSLSANQPNNSPWVCNDSSNPFISQFVIYYPNSGSNAPPDWFVCTLDTSTNPVNIGDPLPPIHLNVDIDLAYKGGVVHNCAEIGRGSAAMPEWYQDQGCVDVPVGAMKNIPTETTAARPPHVSIEKKHSPSRFSTGSKGSFMIKVKNKGAKLKKNMLRVVDHMPGGLSVKTGAFRAGSWSCKGGMVASGGQDVTCAYNRTLGKHGRATLRLNARVAPKDRFPAGVDAVENCAMASVRGAAGVMAAGPKVCDKVRIKRARKSEMPDLSPLGGLIMQMPHGGGGGAAAPAPVRKTPGAVR